MKYVVQISKTDKKEQLFPITNNVASAIAQFTGKMTLGEVLRSLDAGEIIETPYSKYYLSQLAMVKK